MHKIVKTIFSGLFCSLKKTGLDLAPSIVCSYGEDLGWVLDHACDTRAEEETDGGGRKDCSQCSISSRLGKPSHSMAAISARESLLTLLCALAPLVGTSCHALSPDLCGCRPRKPTWLVLPLRAGAVLLHPGLGVLGAWGCPPDPITLLCNTVVLA